MSLKDDVLQLIRSNENITRWQITSRLNKPLPAVEECIRDLEQAGEIERTGDV